ncbi:MAG: class I SAM-dependent methyltransferase [Candidatus Kapaibacterium sp.]|nr:methyltransferase regulatory domain-containing protein [Bacteroidota bacterium]
MDTHTPYDDVFYPTGIHQSVTVDRLYVMGKILGVKPTPIETATVLEIGCGDGMHILPHAWRHPQSKVVGLDYASTNITKAVECKSHLSIDNIEFICADIQDFTYSDYKFDYIIVHGLYAWVHDSIKEAILLKCKEHLSENGICVVSYNTMPGGHIRLMTREIMRFHTQQFSTTKDKVREARAMIYFLAKANSGMQSAYKYILQEELKRIASYPDAAFIHDDLGEIYTPISFTDFINHASKHSLTYLGEADFVEMNDEMPNEEITQVFKNLHKGDLLQKEQYMDYLRYRRFRQTMLVHDHTDLKRVIDSCFLDSLFISINLTTETPTLIYDNSVVQFKDESGKGMGTDSPLVKAALVTVSAQYPKRFNTKEIVEMANKTLGLEESPTDLTTVQSVLLKMYYADLIEVYAERAEISIDTEKPKLWEYAKQLLELRLNIPTQNNVMYHVEGNVEREFLKLCDGTAHFRENVEAISSLISSRELDWQKDEDVEEFLLKSIKACKKSGLLSN